MDEQLSKKPAFTNKNNVKPAPGTNKNKKRYFSDNHSMRKRPTPKPFQRKNDFYVTNKSNFVAQKKQCESLLSAEKTEFDEIYLHCVGNAINRGINLALTLVQESNNAFGYEANTSTINIVDDFHPLNDEEDFNVQKRLNSCLHIRVFRHSKIA